MAPPKLKDHKQMLQAEEEEIDRLSSAIRKLDLRILHEKQGLARMKTRTRRTIKKYEARAALKTEQLAALTARMNHHRSSSVPEPDSLEDKDDLLVKCTWDTRDPRKLVIWQLERHIHWATRTPAWDSREALHEMLDLRTAAELRAGKPPGRGNLRLQRQFCRVDPGEKFDWGKPAEALRAFAEDVFRDAGVDVGAQGAGVAHCA
ncbi:hypothetical protein N7470_001089 [Penicillium chermesinum]|nr:hypothetical protein N7470_001089 [Penicillium chermesinum]